ncbi:hypothetical protein QVD17_18796 [Tagetes erecta]|uniref:Uncharacterized protein n=1 Tax=Tagetes erecta TaxID=13708 RepID=A0AAD8KIK4_TARER|nr:hypothetical protein QVD17_18796 [Tagetes erecta]
MYFCLEIFAHLVLSALPISKFYWFVLVIHLVSKTFLYTPLPLGFAVSTIASPSTSAGLHRLPLHLRRSSPPPPPPPPVFTSVSLHLRRPSITADHPFSPNFRHG